MRRARGCRGLRARARAPVNSKSRSVRDEKDPNVRLKSISITSETSAGR
jgi:hypothetical protein